MGAYSMRRFCPECRMTVRAVKRAPSDRLRLGFTGAMIVVWGGLCDPGAISLSLYPFHVASLIVAVLLTPVWLLVMFSDVFSRYPCPRCGTHTK